MRGSRPLGRAILQHIRLIPARLPCKSDSARLRHVIVQISHLISATSTCKPVSAQLQHATEQISHLISARLSCGSVSAQLQHVTEQISHLISARPSCGSEPQLQRLAGWMTVPSTALHEEQPEHPSSRGSPCAMTDAPEGAQQRQDRGGPPVQSCWAIENRSKANLHPRATISSSTSERPDNRTGAMRASATNNRRVLLKHRVYVSHHNTPSLSSKIDVTAALSLARNNHRIAQLVTEFSKFSFQ